MTRHYDDTPILIDIPMPIVTPRLIIRPAQAGDGQALFDAKKDSMTELKKWMLWAQDDETVDKCEILVRQQYAKYIMREDILMFAFDRARENHLIAGTGLHRFDWKTRIFEIGYWVRTPDTGQGYAQELANALTRFAFDALRAHKVFINHAHENHGSQAVIQKLGYEKEAVSKQDHRLPDGRIVDEHIYARFDTKGLPPLDVKWGVEP